MGPQPTQPSGARATVMPEGTTCVPIMNEVPRPAGPAAAGAAPGPAHEKPDRAVEDDKPNPAVEAFNRIKGDLDELKEYGSYYLAAKVDGIKQSVRNIGLYAALGLVGAVVGGAMLATAAGLIVVGIARGLGALFGDQLWLGYLVTGILIVGAVGALAWMMMKKLTGAWRSSTIKKYEQRKATQRIRFGGHNVSDRAAASGHRDLTEARPGGAVADGGSSAKAGGPGGSKGH
jgi:hypothetical protein